MGSGVLIVGGCGCVGFHLVRALLDSKDFEKCQLHVLSRNPTRNLIDDSRVHYHAGSIDSQHTVARLISDLKPEVVFHTAAPVSRANDGGWDHFYRTNVQGTRNLLESAKRCVKAFVYTSSVSVMKGQEYHFAKEDWPLNLDRSAGDAYSVTKALGEKLVLEANEPVGLKTASLRICTVYGERDQQMIAGSLDVLKSGQHKMQIGDNTNLFDTVSVENVANAHLLAAKALLAANLQTTGLKVDGEAFNITDDDPIPFWDFQRLIWAVAGTKIKLEEITIFPAWFILSLASLVEWIYWVFTLGRRRPKTFRRHVMEYAACTRTFSIEKAKERLGYRPVRYREAHIKAGVEWALRENRQTTKL